MLCVAGTPQFNSCQQKKWPMLSNESWCCVRLCRQRGRDCGLPGTEPGTLGHRGQSKLVLLVKAHNNAHKHAQSQTHSSTKKKQHTVRLKSMIKNSGTDNIPGYLHEHTCRTSLPSSLHCALVVNLVRQHDDYDKSCCKI